MDRTTTSRVFARSSRNPDVKRSVQENMRKINWIIVAFAFVTAGCSSVAVRTGEVPANNTSRVYCGVRESADSLAWFTKGLADPEIAPFSVLMLPWGIIDLPLCAVFDTVCLPFDIGKHLETEQDTGGYR